MSDNLDSNLGPDQSQASAPVTAPTFSLDRKSVRWGVYRLFIVVSCVIMVARIMIVQSADGSTPFLSANDRSRWCTIRALGDEGTYKIDTVVMQDGEIDRNWMTIDRVVHKGSGDDRLLHQYSSKPTLLPTLLAIEYQIVKWATDWKLAEDTFSVARLMLVLTNVLPIVGYFVLLCLLVERYANNAWTRVAVIATATFATFLTSFAITLNNHLPAAISVLAAVYCLLAIWNDDKRDWGHFFFAGLAAAFAAANELPALSFLAVAGGAALWKNPKQTLLGFLPAVTLIAAGFFLTNYMAHGTWKPAYAHRQDGELVATIDGDFGDELNSGAVPAALAQEIRGHSGQVGFVLSDGAKARVALPDRRRWDVVDKDGNALARVTETKRNQAYELRLLAANWVARIEGDVAAELNAGEVPAAFGAPLSRSRINFEALFAENTEVRRAPRHDKDAPRRWEIQDLDGHERLAVVETELNATYEIRLWDNWYEYDGSYWLPGSKSSIDQGEASPGWYAFHMLIGHHGIFSLTPVWLISLAGLLMAVVHGEYRLRGFALLSLMLLIVVFAFYASRPLEDRNYGGQTSGLRWMFWFTPIFLIGLIPALDALSRVKGGKFVFDVALAISVFSVSVSPMNPWVHPWLYRWFGGE